MGVKIKRVYKAPAPGDGYRILLDRIWPRGISKQDASISRWLKTIAPSTELRKWFSHSPDRWREFRRRYLQELNRKDDELAIIRNKLKRTQNVTLVYDQVNLFSTPQLSRFFRFHPFTLKLIGAGVPQGREQSIAIIKHGYIVQYGPRYKIHR